MADAAIWVLAGTNGAGKSSIAGARFRAGGADYFNPDEATRQIREAEPSLSLDDANSRAWNEGKRLLERAIAERLDFAFETTLGGRSITDLLQSAITAGIEVSVWFAGLASPELHIERVRSRVARGGHDIPEENIRRRYDASRENLITLLPGLAALRVFDNSADADPATGMAPRPRLLLHMKGGQIVEVCELTSVPTWAKPIIAAAYLCAGG